VATAFGRGADRGAILWNGKQYRVSGLVLCEVSATGVISDLSAIPGADRCILDYSFDVLSISNGQSLYYWDGSVLTQVTDPDLGVVVDHKFIDGYFVSTDGTSVVVTELNDRMSVNPLKYGSSELDPDPVYGLLAPRQELHVVNRHTIEVFDNIGGNLFPFQRIKGAQIMKGAVGTHACCEFMDAVAFVGSGRNEPVSVYIGANGMTAKIATREIDILLSAYSDADLSGIVVDQRVGMGQELLYIRLPDKTLVYDAAASKAFQSPVWAILQSGVTTKTAYRMSSPVWFGGKWWCGDTETQVIGVLDESVSSHFGIPCAWEFSTAMVYNESRGGIVHELELVALPGRVALGDNPMIETSYSVDGRTWSQSRSIRCGTAGESGKRLIWLQQGMLRSYRIQRFTGDSSSHLSVMRLESRLEPLGY
jgi:hypothetical protein